MQKYNLPLILGSLILLLILTVVIFPQLFTDKSPYNLEQLRFLVVDGKLNIESAPHPPSSDFLLGSDEYGRDIYSRIIYGTKLTILMGILIALGRFVLALPFALSGGFGNQPSKSIIKQFNTVFSAIPAILISIIILSLDFFSGLSKTGSIISFVAVLSIVSWAALGDVILERVEFINKQNFITSEKAIGKRKTKIALENVVPHLAPELIVLFFMEVARALSMIMQLGIFNLFVGNLKIILSSDYGTLTFAKVSFEPEWASMLGTSRNMLSTAPWALLFPALAFFISVLGFNLFGEGLRNIMQKKDSRVVPVIRKFISFDIVKIFKFASKKSKIKFAAVTLILILAVFAQKIYNGAHYKFETEQNTAISYDQVIIGTESAYSTADEIVDEMKKLNIEPLEENYIIEYKINTACINTSQNFMINSNNGSVPASIEDYSFVQTGNFDYTGSIYDTSKEDMFSFVNYEDFNDTFVMIDKTYYTEAAISYFINQIDNNSTAKGVLLISDSRNDSYILDESQDMFVVLITPALADSLRTCTNIEISAQVQGLGTTGKNIIGIYKGNGNLSEEAILIGMAYNYQDKGGQEALQFDLELMRRLCTLYENKRSIIFMFLDGTLGDSQNGIYPIAEDFPYSSSKIQLYLDLTSLNTIQFDEIRFSTAQAPFTRQFAWSVGHQLEELFEKENITIRELETTNSGGEYIFTEDYSKNTFFWNRGFATIVISTEEQGTAHTIDDIGSILLEVINKNNY